MLLLWKSLWRMSLLWKFFWRMLFIIITKIFLRNVFIMKIFMRNIVITKLFIRNVVHHYNACRLTVYEIHNYILFRLYLAVILRNSVNNKFIKLVEQQLKLINYSWPYSELWYFFESKSESKPESESESESDFNSAFMNLDICISLLYICILLNKLVENIFYPFS